MLLDGLITYNKLMWIKSGIILFIVLSFLILIIYLGSKKKTDNNYTYQQKNNLSSPTIH